MVALTLTKADPVMLKIIDPPDAQFFVNILHFFTTLLGPVVEEAEGVVNLWAEVDPNQWTVEVSQLLFNKKIIVIAPQALQIHHRSSPGGVWAKGELVWATCDLAQRPEARGQITGSPHVLATARNSRFVHTETGCRNFI